MKVTLFNLIRMELRLEREFDYKLTLGKGRKKSKPFLSERGEKLVMDYLENLN